MGGVRAGSGLFGRVRNGRGRAPLGSPARAGRRAVTLPPVRFRHMSREYDKLHTEIEALFSDLWQVPRFSGTRPGFRPNVDSFHTDDPHQLTVVVELPGV